MTSIGTTSGTTTPLITLNGSTGTISGGTISGATITGGTIKGSSIYANTLNIGGYEVGDTTKGNFRVDSNGNLIIKDAETFKVTSAGHLTATSATIGGWNVTETKI